MLPLSELTAGFERHWWPRLVGQSLDAAGQMVRDNVPNLLPDYLNTAVKIALWDLRAKHAGLPLFRLLGGKDACTRVRAYGSILDFHLSDEDALTHTQTFLAMGMKAIKVKIGAADVQRDIARLRLISDHVPADVQITADANIAWDAGQTVQRLNQIRDAGVRLGYIEDPIPYEDLQGYARLARAGLEVPVVGHDYAPTANDIRMLLDTGALSMKIGRAHV